MCTCVVCTFHKNMRLIDLGRAQHYRHTQIKCIRIEKRWTVVSLHASHHITSHHILKWHMTQKFEWKSTSGLCDATQLNMLETQTLLPVMWFYSIQSDFTQTFESEMSVNTLAIYTFELKAGNKKRHFRNSILWEMTFKAEMNWKLSPFAEWI